MPKTKTETRSMRLCDVCGQLDDHPRHVQTVAPGDPEAVPTDDFLDNVPDGTPARAVAEIMDPTTVVRHMDCCGSRGCTICQAVLAAADSAHGEQLTAAIVSGATDNLDFNQGGDA